MNVDRFQLHGTYRTPLFKYGVTVECEVRGEMVITGISDSPIPWPVGRIKGRGGPAYPVVYKGLARAVRREANQAVAHHFGVTAQTVSVWRKALGVDPSNPGTSKLRSAHYQAGVGEKVVAGANRVLGDPQARRTPAREDCGGQEG
jgi:hypothetical protein